jgi:SAM-dependent MidA family methyltransferase
MAPSPHLPAPSEEALAHSAALVAQLRARIEARGGWIPFSEYMEFALYAPGLGYYSAGSRKLGEEGDFITAPELGKLFGRTLARQLHELIAAGFDQILEVGAGSGTLAATLLEELETRGALPHRYLILELSPELRVRERDTLAARVPHLLERVAWLNGLPPNFRGVVIGNEVLDAMPMEIVRIGDTGHEQAGVDADLQWRFVPASGELSRAAAILDLPVPYRTEIPLMARHFVTTLGSSLEAGVLLFIDYGFPRHEFYHRQRDAGTLMCHYRHHAHDDPFFLPGLQDITSHVDFSAVAHAGREAGLAVLGYCNQAQFLVNCGVTEVLTEAQESDTRTRPRLSAEADKLLSPAEMGELFKVIALGRGIEAPLLGFRARDRKHTL